MLSPSKLLIVLTVVGLIWLIFFHRSVPRVTKRLGRSLGEVKDAGSEILGDAEIPGSALSRYETRWGQALAEQLLAEHTLCPDPDLQARVLRIGQRLAGGSTREQLPWRFAVLESSEVQTWAVPGGTILLSRPLLKLVGGDDNRLAGVIGHEIAHVEKRHALRDRARSTALQAGIRLLTAGRSPLTAPVGAAFERLFSGREGHGHSNEMEADARGCELAAAADYDPSAYLRFLGELIEGTPEFPGPALALTPYVQSHPSLPERIAALGPRWRSRGLPGS